MVLTFSVLVLDSIIPNEGGLCGTLFSSAAMVF